MDERGAPCIGCMQVRSSLVEPPIWACGGVCPQGNWSNRAAAGYASDRQREIDEIARRIAAAPEPVLRAVGSLVTLMEQAPLLPGHWPVYARLQTGSRVAELHWESGAPGHHHELARARLEMAFGLLLPCSDPTAGG